MKKTIALLLSILLLCLLLAACKGNATTVTPTATPTLEETSQAPEQTEVPQETYTLPGVCSFLYRPDIFQCTESEEGVSFRSISNSKVYVSLVCYPELSQEEVVDGILLQKDLTKETLSEGVLGEPPVQTKTLQYSTEDSEVFVHVIPCGEGCLLMELGGIGEENPDELSAKGLMLDTFTFSDPVG